MNEVVFFKEKPDIRICFFSVVYVTSLLANLAVGYRYISIGSLVQSGGIFIFPLSFIISDILTEQYGSYLATKLVHYGLACQIIFALYAFIIVRLPAPIFLYNQEIYYQTFNPYLKFAFASTINIWAGSWVNILVLSKLSEYTSGKYFVLRSFSASSIGEFIVTFISMFLANFTRLDLFTLFYMIGCCYLVKTFISFIAIWPAALIIFYFNNKKEFIYLFSIKKMLNPLNYLKNIFFTAWHTKGSIYKLEFINLKTQKVNLYYKGTRGTIKLPLTNLIYNQKIINGLSSIDAAHVGYYYGISEGPNNYKDFFNNNDNLSVGKLVLVSILRNGKIFIEDNNGFLQITNYPTEIYKNNLIINKFTSSQALHIGYLAGLSQKKSKKNKIKNKSHLKLVK